MTQGFRDRETLLEALRPVLKPLIYVFTGIRDSDPFSLGFAEIKFAHSPGDPDRFGNQPKCPGIILLDPALDHDPR